MPLAVDGWEHCFLDYWVGKDAEYSSRLSTKVLRLINNVCYVQVRGSFLCCLPYQSMLLIVGKDGNLEIKWR